MSKDIEIALPPHALRALNVLEDAGFEAWCVGGFVRDALLGRAGADIDIATQASWQQTARAFSEAGYPVHETGTKHGTVTVVIDGDPFEVTTYRTDGMYSDGRHPDSVTFVKTIEEDLARRDFTMNAMAYHPQRGLLDPFGGADDLARGVIRTVGDPMMRFAEDGLRVLRGCRFVSQLGFPLETATRACARKCKSVALHVSSERITYELEAFLLGDHVHDALMETADILSGVLPELTAMIGFDQHTPYHLYDVLEHTAYVVERVPAQPLMRWAALFHDMGKPAAYFSENGRGHFFGHGGISAVMAQGIMDRLVFSPAFKKKVVTLVRIHDDYIEPTPRAVKRAIHRLGDDTDLFYALCMIKRADALSQNPAVYPNHLDTADALLETLALIEEQHEAFTISQLALGGNDVLALGVPAGPQVGAVLNAALDAVIDERVENDRAALVSFARAYLGAHHDVR